MIEITVREQIKAACDNAGISATELGVKMGMSQQNSIMEVYRNTIQTMT